MLELTLGLTGDSILGIVGTLAIIVSVITEIFKNIVSQKFPTKALALIISLIVTLLFVIFFCTLNVKTIILGIVGSFVVAFISMYGWDTFSEIKHKLHNPF